MSRLIINTALAMAFFYFGMLATDLVAQEHFIGEDKAVNRVIRLQSQPTPATPPEVRVAKKQTSRAVQQEKQNRTTTPVTSPSLVEYDEIEVPQKLKAPMNPVVQRKTGSSGRPNVPEAPISSSNKPVVSKSFSSTKRSTTPVSDKKTDQYSTAKTTSSVTTLIKSPRVTNLHVPASVQIDVNNEADLVVENVVLRAVLPSHAKLVSSTPEPMKLQNNTYEFNLPRLAGNSTRGIKLQVVPTQKVPLEIATQLLVANSQRTVVAVQEPSLTLSLNGPQTANIGQTVTHELVVTNVGDGPATDVRLETEFPTALREITQSSSPVIKRIDAGESVKVQLKSLAQAAGQVQLRVAANAKGVQTKNTALPVAVFQPELRISAMGPKLNFVQRDGIYTIGLENTGQVDVTDVMVSLAVPEGMKVTTINREANIDTDRGLIMWRFANIPADTSTEIQLKATAVEEGNQVCKINVQSNETRDKEIQLATMVTTRADVSVRIRNDSGPVQVGGKAHFVVEVENKGSRRANGVAVVVKLPETLTPEKNSQDFAAQANNAITFSEAGIAPGEVLKFEFSAIGVAAGEHVVRSTLEVAETKRQMISEDTVYVYEVDEARVSESVSPMVPRR